MSDPILVTGAGGFVGSHLVDLLANQPDPVEGWLRPGGRAAQSSSTRVRWSAVDLLDRRAVSTAIEAIRPAAIYHCGGAAHIGASWEHAGRTVEQNVLGTHHLLEGVRRAGLRCRILIPGSAAVYAPSATAIREDDPLQPASPYAVSKLGQEMLARHACADDGLAIILTRSFNHIGPRQAPTFVASGVARQLALIEAGRIPPVLEVGNIEARRDLTDVRDTVRAYRDLLARGRAGVAYNVCSGHAHSIKELIRGLVQRIGMAVEIKVDPARYRPNDAPLVLGDNRRLRDEVGWRPEIPFERTLDDLLQVLAIERDGTRSMKLLITGGTGYIGGALVAAAAARGHEVVVFSRTASSSGLPGRLVNGDIRDAEAVAEAASGCDAICHTAALVSIWRRRRRDFDDVNVGGLRNLLSAAARAGITRIVYTSSFLAMPPSDSTDPGGWNDYQRTKLAADTVAAEAVAAGSPLIRMYPGVVYGPGRLTEGNLVGRLLSDHLAGKLPGVIGADRIWSYSFIDDVADGHLRALERGQPGARYILGGENAPQMRVFELLRDATERRLPRRIPYAAAHLLALAEEARATVFGANPLLTRGTLEIFRHDWALESGTAIRDLGYHVTPLSTGFDRTLASLTH